MSSKQDRCERNVSTTGRAICKVLALGVLTCSVLIRINAAQKLVSDYSNPATPHLWISSNSVAPKPATPKKKNGEPDFGILPKIEVHQVKPLLWADGKPRWWADGKDFAIITISLEATREGQRWIYSTREEMEFILEPVGAAFAPSTIKIPAGSSRSDPVVLTAEQAGKVPVNCLPAHEYKGLLSAQSVEVEFITPIKRIGIEPTPDSVLVNISKPFEVYLYDDANPTKKLAPSKDVDVQFVSETGYGEVLGSPLQLTNHTFTRYVSYIGRRTGDDTIIASAHYLDLPLKTRSERSVIFHWDSFGFGVVGTIIGSLLRSLKEKRKKRLRPFVESFAFGIAFCVAVIYIPWLIKNSSPLLVLALAMMWSNAPDVPNLIRSLFGKP